jgi:hypothetical protein
MGDVIRRSAATEDIFSDLATTLVRARARGAKWQDLAEAHIAEVANLIEEMKTRRQAAGIQLAVRQATADAASERAALLIGKVSDEIWNAIGRPANDPGLSVIFPGGIAYYTEAGANDQPHRMDLLVTLLESNIHPRLDPATAKALAEAVRQEAANLRAALDPAQLARAEVRLAARIAMSLGRSCQMELANLKRRYKAEGFSEPEIHLVIPDHPRVAAVTTPTPPPPPAPGRAPVPSLPPVPAVPAIAPPRNDSGPRFDS